MLKVTFPYENYTVTATDRNGGEPTIERIVDEDICEEVEFYALDSELQSNILDHAYALIREKEEEQREEVG